MNRQFQRIGFLFLVVLVSGIACDLVSSVAIQTPGLPETLAAETWSAMQTIAYLSITPSYTNAPPTETPTITNTPTISPTPSPTKTPIPPLTMRPTNTPQPTTNTPIPTVTPVPTGIYYPPGYYPSGGGGSGSGNTGKCLAARLVRHVTIPSEEILPPSYPFTKIWRIQNVGTCTWDTSVKMALVSGDSMGGDDIRLSSKVRPGKTIDVEIDMVSPSSDGAYTGNWKLKYMGEKFGDGNDPFTVRIRVESSAHGTIYNFATHYCSAAWRSSRTQNYLPCPGKIGSSNGFVRRVESPHLENGSFSQPGIWTHPPLTSGGEIWGTFPALIIQPGDRFMAELACLYDYGNCEVTFDLLYQLDGGSEKISLGHWSEVYDGATTIVDIDLSFLVSHYAGFVLQATGHGDHPKENAAFWYMPRIYRP
jgi:hypothetical protein